MSTIQTFLELGDSVCGGEGRVPSEEPQVVGELRLEGLQIVSSFVPQSVPVGFLQVEKHIGAGDGVAEAYQKQKDVGQKPSYRLNQQRQVGSGATHWRLPLVRGVGRGVG